MSRTQRASAPDLPPAELATFPARRIAEVKAGDHVRDLQTPDKRADQGLTAPRWRTAAACSTYVDITDLTNKANELERLATTDPLTGLFNRRHFLECLDAEWSRFQRYYRAVSAC